MLSLSWHMHGRMDPTPPPPGGHRRRLVSCVFHIHVSFFWTYVSFSTFRDLPCGIGRYIATAGKRLSTHVSRNDAITAWYVDSESVLLRCSGRCRRSESHGHRRAALRLIASDRGCRV